MAVIGDIQTVTADGSVVVYDNPKFILDGTVRSLTTDDIRLHFSIISGGSGIGTSEFSYLTTRTALDALTASGATTTIKFDNVCDQILKTFLESLSDNSGVTFTIT